MRVLQGHKKEVRAVAYIPDGRLISGGGDNSVRIWDVLRSECTATIKAKGPVYAVAASPDGKTIAYGGRHASGAESNFAYLSNSAGEPRGQFELRTQEERLEQVPGTFVFRSVPTWAPRSIWSLSFSADGKYLATACRRPGSANIPYGGGGRVWQLTSSGAEIELPDDTYAVSFAPSGDLLGMTRHKSAQFQNLPTLSEPIRYPLTADWSAAVAFVPRASLTVVASMAFLYFVDPNKFAKPAKVKTGVRRVIALAASPDGKTLLVGGVPGAIEVYDLPTRTRTTTYDFGIGGVHALGYAPDGLTFAAGGDKGLVVCDIER